jgi:hypothetical protein
MYYFHLIYRSRSNPLHHFDGLVEFSSKYDKKYPILTIMHISSCNDPSLSSITVGDSFIWVKEADFYPEETTNILLHEWRSGKNSHYFDISYHNSSPTNTTLYPVSKRFVELQKRKTLLIEELTQIQEELQKTEFLYEPSI